MVFRRIFAFLLLLSMILNASALADTESGLMLLKLNEIETEAFYGDSALREVELPAATRVIGSRAFAECKNLAAFYCYSKDVQIAEDAFENTGMRQKMEQHRQIQLIIDCYNAAPESMKAALKVLHHANAERTKQGQRAGRTVAVLGDMRELGPTTDSLHQSVGKFCARLGTSALFTFGPHALQIAQGARQSGMSEDCIFSFPDLNNPLALATCLSEYAKPGDTVLFKASRGTELERVIDLFKTL